MATELFVLNFSGRTWDSPAMARDSSDRRTLVAAFVFAVFGWGLGFYGPPIFFAQVLARTGWAASSVAWLLTLHHLSAAALILKVPRWHDRVGIFRVTLLGTAVAAAGILGWSLARTWAQLAVCAVLSGAGWGCTGGACITAVIARWYRGPRAAGLTMAYNGATVGGAAFSVIWPWLIGAQGFTAAAVAVGFLACGAVGAAGRVLDERTPAPARHGAADAQVRVPRDARVYTLAVARALSLLAQIGVLAHLFAMCAPRIGANAAGWLVGGAVAMALAGRQISWKLGMRRNVHPRAVLAVFLLAQAGGCMLLACVPPDGLRALICGCVLFGIGIGTATSLPAVIAQHEFEPRVAVRATAIVLSGAQATYSFAPALFGLLLVRGGPQPALGPDTAVFFTVAALLEAASAACVALRLLLRPGEGASRT